MPYQREACERLDRDDPLAGKRKQFALPEGQIYLDGNSLGLLPKAVAGRVARVVTEEWGQSLITSWNRHGWFEMPARIGDKIAPLIGAPAGSVIAADTISVNMFKLLSGALRLRPGRRVILTDSGNFPSDIYVAQGLAGFLGQGCEVRIVPPEEVEQSLTEDVAVAMITEVDYRTARRHDMAKLTAAAHRAGALTVWDLAHSAGAMPIDLTGANADLAVGCTYKYLNGGPGSAAFVYVRPDLQNEVQPGLVGWWGHARPFAFETDFEPGAGMVRQQCGTQAMISMAALDTAMDVWSDVDMKVVEAKAHMLCSIFIAQVEERCGRYGLRLAGPRDMKSRGSHVSFHCPQGYAVMQALIAAGVVGDFRAPDLIRFGFTPLYTQHVEAYDAAAKLLEVLRDGLWNKPEFLARKAVT
jgi:kynureninase